MSISDANELDCLDAYPALDVVARLVVQVLYTCISNVVDRWIVWMRTALSVLSTIIVSAILVSLSSSFCNVSGADEMDRLDAYRTPDVVLVFRVHNLKEWVSYIVEMDRLDAYSDGRTSL